MHIRPTLVRLVRLNFGLSMYYLEYTFCFRLLLSLLLSGDFGLRLKFLLNSNLSKIHFLA